MSEHTHKLRKHRYKNGTAVFFCSLNCNFKIECGLAIGKISLCNICNEPFPMDEYTIKLAKPHCRNCGKVLVKLPDGKRSYVNRNRLDKIAGEMAGNSTQSLRERLGRVVTMEKDEDI